MRFDGKVLFATVGGGSGLAAATARCYTSEGGRVDDAGFFTASVLVPDGGMTAT